MELAAQLPLGIQQHGDDAHGLLGVVAAVAQRVERSRDELEDPKPAIDRKRRALDEDPGHREHEPHGQHQTQQRREHDGSGGLRQPAPDHDADAGLGDAGAEQAADQRVRAARRNTEEPRDQIPDDGAGQRAEHDARIDDLRFDDAGAERLRHVQAEHQEGDEIEERRPGDGVLRAQHARRHDGGDRIRRVVEAIEEIECQGERDQRNEQRQGERGRLHRHRSAPVTRNRGRRR